MRCHQGLKFPSEKGVKNTEDLPPETNKKKEILDLTERGASPTSSHKLRLPEFLGYWACMAGLVSHGLRSSIGRMMFVWQVGSWGQVNLIIGGVFMDF